jgi:hypothetical protein
MELEFHGLRLDNNLGVRCDRSVHNSPRIVNSGRKFLADVRGGLAAALRTGRPSALLAERTPEEKEATLMRRFVLPSLVTQRR